MTQTTPIPASTEAPWSGFSSRGYSNPQPRESARRTFNSNLSGNEWGEVRRACKDQQLVCYKVSITDRTMWPQLVEIVDGLDLGLKVDGVFEKFKFGFTMKGKQGAPRDSGYGRRFFFPEETADNKLRTVMEAVDCKGDVVGFEQTRHSPEGFPYQLTFMQAYTSMYLAKLATSATTTDVEQGEHFINLFQGDMHMEKVANFSNSLKEHAGMAAVG